MADNTLIDNGALTDYTVADDDDGVAKHQYVKLEYGADGTFTKVASGASALPIQDGGNSITVDDGAGSLTVDGTVSVSGTVTVDTELSAAAALTDNFANPTVPGVGAFSMGWDGTNWDRIRAPGGIVEVTAPSALNTRALDVATDDVRVGGMAALDAAVADNPVTVGGRASTAVPTAVSTDGDAVWAWLSRNGALNVIVRDSVGDSAMDDTNDALRVNVVAGSGAGVTHTDKGAFTVSTDDGVPVFGMMDDTSPSTLAEGEAGVIRATANRALHVNLRDASGAELAVGGGTQYDEDTASVAAEKVTMAGVVRKDAAASLVDTDGDRTELQVDANGALRVTGGGGGTEVTEDAAAAANPTGGMMMARRVDTPAATTDTDGDVIAVNATNFGELYVAGRAGGFVIQGSGNAAIEVLGSGVDDASNTTNELVTAALGYVFDGTGWDRLRGDAVGGAFIQGPVAHDGVGAGNPLLLGGRAQATAPTDVSTDGDAVRAWFLRNGALATVLTAAGALIGGDATNGLDVDVTRVSGTVTVDTELAAAAALSDNFSNPTTSPVGAFAMGWDGTNWDRIRAPGGVVEVTAPTALEVVGDVAHDVAAPANPVVIGAQMETQADSAPGTRAGTDGDAVKLASMDGALFVASSAPQSSHTHFNSTSTLQTDATIKAAPGAGLSIYVTDIVFSIGAATASSIFFEEGSTTVLGPYYLEAIAGRGLAISFKTPKKITANTALTVTNTGSVTYGIDVGWFVGPG